MSDLTGQEGELRFTITVKRAESGKEETFEMIGKLVEEPEKEQDNVSHTLSRSA